LEEPVASKFGMLRISKLGTVLAATGRLKPINLSVRCLSVSHVVTANDVPRSLIFSTLKTERHIPPKHYFEQNQHGATFQKKISFTMFIAFEFQIVVLLSLFQLLATDKVFPS
jgi:hypothetical protein